MPAEVYVLWIFTNCILHVWEKLYLWKNCHCWIALDKGHTLSTENNNQIHAGMLLWAMFLWAVSHIHRSCAICSVCEREGERESLCVFCLADVPQSFHSGFHGCLFKTCNHWDTVLPMEIILEWMGFHLPVSCFPWILLLRSSDPPRKILYIYLWRGFLFCFF